MNTKALIPSKHPGILPCTPVHCTSFGKQWDVKSKCSSFAVHIKWLLNCWMAFLQVHSFVRCMLVELFHEHISTNHPHYVLFFLDSPSFPQVPHKVCSAMKTAQGGSASEKFFSSDHRQHRAQRRTSPLLLWCAECSRTQHRLF